MNQAAEALGRSIKAGPVCVRTLAGAWVAEAAHTRVDNFRVARRDRFVANAQSVHDAGAHVFHDGVCLVGQLQENFLVGVLL